MFVTHITIAAVFILSFVAIYQAVRADCAVAYSDATIAKLQIAYAEIRQLKEQVAELEKELSDLSY